MEDCFPAPNRKDSKKESQIFGSFINVCKFSGLFPYFHINPFINNKFISNKKTYPGHDDVSKE